MAHFASSCALLHNSNNKSIGRGEFGEFESARLFLYERRLFAEWPRRLRLERMSEQANNRARGTFSLCSLRLPVMFLPIYLTLVAIAGHKVVFS